MAFLRFLLLLFAATLSFVSSTPTATTGFQHVSSRGPGRKIVGDIPPPTSPRIRDLVNLFRSMLPTPQRPDTAEIRRRYMPNPERRYPNAVFYVNQRRTSDMNDGNPNWGTNRALQLRTLLETQMRQRDPNAESWTLYQAYDCRSAFGIIDEVRNLDFPSDIRRAALSLNQERDWFRQTSAAFAEMVQGTVFLVVEEADDAIGSDSIWATHELPAIQRSQEVDIIWEVRPANIGDVLDRGQDLRLIPYRDPSAIQRHPTHGDPNAPVTSPVPQPPWPPVHDGLKRGDNPINVTIDAKKALEARMFPEIDLSNAVDFSPTPDPAPAPPPQPDPPPSDPAPPPAPPKPPAPYTEGICSFHLTQWKNPTSGGGSPFDNPNDAQWKGPFSVEITLYDGHDPRTQIGYVPRTNANDKSPLVMASKLEDTIKVTPIGDDIQFDLAQQHWKSGDQDHCTVGGYDRGQTQKREMDCHFGCLYGGKPSSDGTPAPAKAAATSGKAATGNAAAGNAIVDAAVDTSDTSSNTDGSFEKWKPVIIGLLLANLVVALALVVLNVVGKCRGRSRPSIRGFSIHNSGAGLYRPVHKKDHDHDMEEAPRRDQSYT